MHRAFILTNRKDKYNDKKQIFVLVTKLFFFYNFNSDCITTLLFIVSFPLHFKMWNQYNGTFFLKNILLCWTITIFYEDGKCFIIWIRSKSPPLMFFRKQIFHMKSLFKSLILSFELSNYYLKLIIIFIYYYYLSENKSIVVKMIFF